MAASFTDWEAELKRRAFAMKKETGMKIGHCYEKMAKAAGYNNYAAWRAAVKESLNGK